jgi:hypothetical protein
MIVDAGGRRKKGALVTRNLKSEEDVYTYLSTKQDPLSASSDYIKGNENAELKRGGSPAPAPTPSGNVKIVTLDMVKQKLGKGATQSQINAYIKQLESTGNFKVQRK